MHKKVNSAARFFSSKVKNRHMLHKFRQFNQKALEIAFESGAKVVRNVQRNKKIKKYLYKQEKISYNMYYI